MPNGQPTSSWSATAFSPVFGESAARLPAGLPYRTIFLLPTATEDRLGAELWRTRPAIPKIPFKTRNEPLRFLLRQRKRILLISLQRNRTRPLYRQRRLPPSDPDREAQRQMVF